MQTLKLVQYFLLSTFNHMSLPKLIFNSTTSSSFSFCAAATSSLLNWSGHAISTPRKPAVLAKRNFSNTDAPFSQNKKFKLAQKRSDIFEWREERFQNNKKKAICGAAEQWQYTIKLFESNRGTEFNNIVSLTQYNRWHVSSELSCEVENECAVPRYTRVCAVCIGNV